MLIRLLGNSSTHVYQDRAIICYNIASMYNRDFEDGGTNHLPAVMTVPNAIRLC